MPCEPLQIGCGSDGIKVNTGQNRSWAYKHCGGGIMFLGSNMPIQANYWANMVTLPLTHLNAFFEAAHVCSYMCYWAQFTNDPNNLCGLATNTSDTRITSYCGTPSRGWPTPV